MGNSGSNLHGKGFKESGLKIFLYFLTLSNIGMMFSFDLKSVGSEKLSRSPVSSFVRF